MTTSPMLFLAEIAEGHHGSPIPASKRAYFQQRLRNRIFNFLLEKFLASQQEGLTKAILARRIEKTPDVVNRWLGGPSNLTVDTIADLLLGISGEELEPGSSSPFEQVENNYSHFEELRGAAIEARNSDVRKAEASSLENYGQKTENTRLAVSA